MNSSTPTRRGPTPRQLRYLRVLAGQTGTTFTPPTSSGEASREIDRLAALKRERGTHRVLPDSTERCVYATAPAPDETSGWGSTATWRSSSPPRAATARPLGVAVRGEAVPHGVDAVGERLRWIGAGQAPRPGHRGERVEDEGRPPGMRPGYRLALIDQALAPLPGHNNATLS
jgi:hypothetical protein